MKESIYNSDLKPFAQKLRKDMTPEEKHLWYDFLRVLPVQVKRQKVIKGYIADFYIPAVKLVIELDGSQHYSEEGMKYDLQRNQVMENEGIIVLRYSNLDINQNFAAVCEDIRMHLSVSKPSPHAGKGDRVSGG